MTNEIAITAIGTAVPYWQQPQMQAAEIVSAALNLNPVEARTFKSMYRATGIEKRHSVMQDFCRPQSQYTFFPRDKSLPFPTTAERMQVYKDNAFTLALAAIENCFLEYENFNPQDITHVITVSCTGMYAPGLDIEIVHQLALPTQTSRLCINFMGCYGAFNAIKTAQAICQSSKASCVLIVSVELCTIHFQKNHTLDNIISNAIFSDGAAALLVQRNISLKKSFSLEKFYCELLPQSSKEMAWQIADQGFDIVLSSYVPEIIQAGIFSFMQRLLINADMKIANIDLYAIHPGGKKILLACEKALNITKEHNKYAYQVLRQFGNMSSATVLFVLKALWNDLQITDNHKTIFSCAFGPGLTLESMLLQVSF